MEPQLKKQDIIVRNEEGSAWFWKLFGGAIISIISVLMVMIITHISASVTQTSTDSKEATRRLWQEISALKAQAITIEQHDQALKERMSFIETSLKERQAADKEHDKQILDLKEKILILENKK